MAAEKERKRPESFADGFLKRMKKPIKREVGHVRVVNGRKEERKLALVTLVCLVRKVVEVASGRNITILHNRACIRNSPGSVAKHVVISA